MAKIPFQSTFNSELFSIRFLPTIFIFILIISLIGISWQTASNTVTETRDEQVNVRSQFVESDIIQRINIYTNALRSAAGFIESSNDVTREEWLHFTQTMEAEEQLPAAKGLGFSEVRGNSAPVVFLEPGTSENRGHLNQDLFDDPLLQASLKTARDNGQATMLSSHLFDDNNSGDKDLIIVYPVYESDGQLGTTASKRQNIEGFVFAPLKINVLFGNLLMEGDVNFNFRIFENLDDEEMILLYERPTNNATSSFTRVKSSTILLNDRIWTIRYNATAEIVPEAIRERPQTIAIAGVTFAVVTSSLAYMIMQRRTRRLAERETKKIENAKDSLLSLASHQLRTPATGVKQYLGMVLEGFTGDLTDDQKDLLGRAYESNERQLRIINEFLYLAKADAGRVIVSPQYFDIGELTKQIISDMQSNFLEAGHELKLSQRAKKIDVYADPHSSRMILENLISNAIKYTPAGGRIKVSLTKNLGEASIKVEDNGVGIDSKDFSKLFKQFSRIPNELSRQTSGSGIGLYLARHLAKANRGRITVKSHPKTGSTFTLFLPLKRGKKVSNKLTNKL